MKMTRFLILTAVALLLINGVALAQTDQDSHIVTMEVSSIAVLNVTGGNITLTIAAPGTGGQVPPDDTDSTCYLQYTATVPSGQTRSLTVAWAGSDSAPAGCSLNVTATPSGGANEGSTSGLRTISDSAQNVVSSIGSCFTGTGATAGANLAYSLTVTDAASLVAGESTSATVTYTLADAS